MALQSVYVALHVEVMRAALGFALNHPISCLENHQDVGLFYISHPCASSLLSVTSHQNPRATRKAAMFGKRSNSMRRNAKAEVTKQGWLYKQVSPAFRSTRDSQPPVRMTSHLASKG